jgi:hypothetical protein
MVIAAVTVLALQAGWLVGDDGGSERGAQHRAVRAAAIVPAAATAAQTQVPAQFNVRCRFSHRHPDDPIVYPRERGLSHMHDFIGNRTTNAHSTTRRLVRGRTNCSRGADRSAYWVPTVYDGRRPVRMRGVLIYYRAGLRDGSEIRPFPRGLRMIAGDARSRHAQPVEKVGWGCTNNVMEPHPPTCPGGKLFMTVKFPQCWDGRRLDSRNHRSHMAYFRVVDPGRRVECPASHPVDVPALALIISYRSQGGSGIRLASGRVHSQHADFFNAWDPRALRTLIRRCLVGRVDCGLK